MRTSWRQLSCAVLAAAPMLWLCATLSRAEEPATNNKKPVGIKPSTVIDKKAVVKPVDPHWKPERCDACHQQGGERQMKFSPFEIETLCTSCHDGEKAKRPVHPSFRPAAGTQDNITHPADWPLVDDKIGCVTCHDIKSHCKKNVRRPALNAVFLRGYDGRNLATFCNKCHVRETQQRFNPHKMLDSKTGKPDQKACLYCHSEVTPVESVTETGWVEAPLRKDVSMLCTGCHTRHIDYFEPGHMNAVATGDIRKRLQADAARGDVKDASKANPSAHTTKSQASSGLLMPLASGDRVVCFTCHNPHQQGVFPADSHVARGAIDITKPGTTHGLRYPQRELCRVCHSH